MSARQLTIQAARNAMADAGIDKSQIDGIACRTSIEPPELARTMGILPKWVDSTSVGGASYLLLVRHAAAAIASGLCTTVLVSNGESGGSRVGELTGRMNAPGGRTSPSSRSTSWSGQF